MVESRSLSRVSELVRIRNPVGGVKVRGNDNGEFFVGYIIGFYAGVAAGLIAGECHCSDIFRNGVFQRTQWRD